MQTSDPFIPDQIGSGNELPLSICSKLLAKEKKTHLRGPEKCWPRYKQTMSLTGRENEKYLLIKLQLGRKFDLQSLVLAGVGRGPDIDRNVVFSVWLKSSSCVWLQTFGASRICFDAVRKKSINFRFSACHRHYWTCFSLGRQMYPQHSSLFCVAEGGIEWATLRFAISITTSKWILLRACQLRILGAHLSPAFSSLQIAFIWFLVKRSARNNMILCTHQPDQRLTHGLMQLDSRGGHFRWETQGKWLRGFYGPPGCVIRETSRKVDQVVCGIVDWFVRRLGSQRWQNCFTIWSLFVSFFITSAS